MGKVIESHSVYSSVFAPAEVAPKQHMMIQVYIHLPEETDEVKEFANEADKNAERRGYEPLEVKLKKNDSVEIELNIDGDSLHYNSRKTVTWRGSFVKRAFDFVVPSDFAVSELYCSVNIFVNSVIAGEMMFLTNIVDSPRQLNTNILARPTKKLFISYSHKDIKSAEKIAKIHEALGIEVFFDKHRLKADTSFSRRYRNSFKQQIPLFFVGQKMRQKVIMWRRSDRKFLLLLILSVNPGNMQAYEFIHTTSNLMPICLQT